MNHDWLERNSILLLIGILSWWSPSAAPWRSRRCSGSNGTIEKVSGMRPYTPLELEGRNIYVREGCYVCHSQLIRTLRDEVERYGHYSLAAESMYDHPFQWGSKRTGPDLARVGGKYSDEWHRAHLADPRSVVPESIMPPYAFLERRRWTIATSSSCWRPIARSGVPYTARPDRPCQGRSGGAGRSQ